VRVNSWSSVRDSVLFDGVQVGRNATIDHVILDKNVVVEEGAIIGVDKEHDAARGFTVTPGGITVVAKGQRVPR
jgi:glucose-1-phosphate adenylyltransferase